LKLITAKRLKRIRTFGGKVLAYAGLQRFGRRHFDGVRGRMKAKEAELQSEQRELAYRQTYAEESIDEIRGFAAPGTTTPTILLLNDCRDQDNYGAQVLVDGLLQILSQSISSYRLRTIPSHWVMDTRYGFGAFVNGGANLRQPKALWPEVADQFEVVADEWLSDQGGAGARSFLDRLKGADVVVLNGEGSIYRRNDSAIRELFVAWFAKTRLGIPTFFLNGMVHLTQVVPILPAMVRKTFAVLDGVAVREPCSLRNLKEYAPRLEARMIPDSAFYFAKELSNQKRLANPLAQQLADVEYFTFDPGAMPTDHRFGKRSALFHLITELKKIVPQAVLISSAPADLFIEQMAQETNSIFVRTVPNYRALMGLFADAKFMVTGRHHNPILGALVGCPSIAFASTSHKVHGVCELLEGQIGTPYDGTDLESNMEAITARAAHYVAHQSSLRPRLTATAARLGEATLEMGEMVKTTLARSAREVYQG
jgi:polysaccharide pyruvyl transferase WcaK-like protein